MSDGGSRKNYRIGEFAEYMGVTPDFLKHFEERGLLKVHQKENGYRYYNFDQASRILDYMRLRNYGVTVKEMQAMLEADTEEAIRLLDEKAEELRRHSERLLAVVEEHKRVQAWQARRRLKPVDWEVCRVEAFYFLPHSLQDRFIDDPRIAVLLKSWMGWMPIAKSAMRIEPVAEGPSRYEPCWGMALPQSFARQYQIPLDDVLHLEPAGKAFVYHFLGEESAFNMDGIARGDHPMFEQMQKLGLKPAGGFYLVVEMKLINPDGSRRGGYGRFVVPVEC